MNPQDLDAMVATLGGDATGFNKMLDQAEKHIDETAKGVEEAGEKVEGFKLSLDSVATALVGTFAAIGGAGYLEDALDSFNKAEESTDKLRWSLKAAGKDVEGLTAQYAAFSKTMRDNVGAEEEETMNLLKLANSMNVTGSAAEKLVKATLGLSAASGESSTELLKTLDAFNKGDMSALDEVFPVLKGIKDETVKLTKANELLADSYGMASEEVLSASGQLKQMDYVFADLKKEFGAIVSEAITPLVQMMKQGVDLFKGLGKEAKTAIITIIMMGIAVGALTAAITVAGTVFNTFFGGIGILVGVLAVGVVALVTSFGGLGETFTALKDKAEAAWKWLEPIRKQLTHLWETISTGAMEVWEKVKQWGIDTWESIAGSASINWDKVRDFIMDALLYAEFGLKNFEKIVDFTWLSIQIGWIAFTEDFKFFFTDQAPALATYFKDNWKQILQTVGDLVKKMGSAVAETFKNIDKIVKGEMNLGDIWKDFSDSANQAMAELKAAIPTRQMGEEEKKLREEWEAMGMELATSFEQFKKDRLGSMTATDEEKAKAENLGKTVGKKMAEGIASQIKMVDAVLAGSMEAMDRYMDYRDRLLGKDATSPGAAGSGAVMPGGVKIEQKAEVGGQKGMATDSSEGINLLRGIKDAIELQNRRPLVTLVKGAF